MADRSTPLPVSLPHAPARPPAIWPWFIAAFALVAAKAPGALTHAQFWAEDAVIFFLQQRTMGFGALLEQYANYLHLAPRIVAQLADWFAAAHAPLLYNLAAVAGAAFSLAYLCTRLHDPAARAMVLLATLLALTNGEIFGTITNLQWFLQLFLFAACLVPAGREGPLRRAGLLIVIAIASLTGPFSVLLSVVACIAFAASLPAWRWPPGARLRAYMWRLDRVRLSTLAVGACIQVAVYASGTVHTPAAMGVREVVAAMPDVLQAHTFGDVVLPGIVFALGLAAMALELLRQGGLTGECAQDRIVVLLLAAVALLQVAAGMVKMTIPLDVGISDRYVFAFKLAFWVGLVLLLLPALRARTLTVVLSAMAFIAITHPDYLRRPAFEDRQWPLYGPALDRGEAIEVPINPAPWTVQVPARPRP